MRKESGESDVFWCVIIWFTVTKPQRSLENVQQPKVGKEFPDSNVSSNDEEVVCESEMREQILKTEMLI